jgi:hypothetical protein
MFTENELAKTLRDVLIDPTKNKIWGMDKHDVRSYLMQPANVARNINVALQGGQSAGMRTVLMADIGNIMFKQRDIKYSDLPEEILEGFGANGITKKDWDILREKAIVKYNGVEFLSTIKLEDLPDYLSNREYYIGLTIRYNSMITQMVEGASPTPGARNRAYRAKYNPSDAGGAVIYAAAKYKSFINKAMEMVVRERVRNGNIGSSLGNISLLAATNITLAAFAQAVKDGINGYDRDYSNPDTYWNMLAQAGVFGHIGNVLANSYTNHGSSNLATDILGPYAGFISSSIGVIQQGLRGGNVAKPMLDMAETYGPAPAIVGTFIRSEMVKALRDLWN